MVMDVNRDPQRADRRELNHRGGPTRTHLDLERLSGKLAVPT
jgi:hypothetical protein